MLIKDEPNLREVQAFPPCASGQDLMMGSPSELTSEQLDELTYKKCWENKNMLYKCELFISPCQR